MTKAVFIDIDDTLLDFDLCARDCIEKGFTDWGLPYSERDYLAFKRINDGLWLDLECGKINKAQLFERRWNLIFDELELRSEEAIPDGFRGVRRPDGTPDGPAFEKLFKQYLYDAAIPVEGASEILVYLAGRYPVYALSNGSQKQQCNRLSRAGMLPYFAEVFTSERMGAQKPKQAFFDEVFRQLDIMAREHTAPIGEHSFMPLPGVLRPEETMMIGDSLTADIGGSIAYGIRTIWLNRTGKSCDMDSKPDHEVSSMDEIRELL